MRVEHGIGSKAAPGWIQSKKPQGAERLVNRLPHRVVEADLLELIGRDIGSTFPGLRVYHPDGVRMNSEWSAPTKSSPSWSAEMIGSAGGSSERPSSCTP